MAFSSFKFTCHIHHRIYTADIHIYVCMYIYIYYIYIYTCTYIYMLGMLVYELNNIGKDCVQKFYILHKPICKLSYVVEVAVKQCYDMLPFEIPVETASFYFHTYYVCSLELRPYLIRALMILLRLR